MEGFSRYRTQFWASQVALVVKNPPANAWDIRDMGSIPGLERSSAGGHGKPPQYFCLRIPVDRGAWQAVIPRIRTSRTQLKWLSTHARKHIF